jgi:hypothetical protein
MAITAAKMLLSPNRRRIAHVDDHGPQYEANLRTLGWTNYEGPAKVTAHHKAELAGWIIPGSDLTLDALRVISPIGSHDLKRR